MAKSSEPGQTAVDRWLAPILAAERELDERERLFPA